MSLSIAASRASPIPTAGTRPASVQVALRHWMARGWRASTQPPLISEIMLMTAAVKLIGASCSKVTQPNTISPSAKPLNAWTKLPRAARLTNSAKSVGLMAGT